MVAYKLCGRGGGGRARRGSPRRGAAPPPLSGPRALPASAAPPGPAASWGGAAGRGGAALAEGLEGAEAEGEGAGRWRARGGAGARAAQEDEAGHVADVVVHHLGEPARAGDVDLDHLQPVGLAGAEVREGPPQAPAEPAARRREGQAHGARARRARRV